MEVKPTALREAASVQADKRRVGESGTKENKEKKTEWENNEDKTEQERAGR